MNGPAASARRAPPLSSPALPMQPVSTFPVPFRPIRVRPRPAAFVSVLVAAALLAACGKSDDAKSAGGGASSSASGASGAGGPPPVEVGVVVAAMRAVGLVNELPGRVEASRTAQVRARVPGIVLRRVFTEGSDVKAGQPLFRIDPSTLEAAQSSAQATLARAQANLAQATAQADRYKPLLEANAISKQDYVNAVAAQKQAEADVASGRAAQRTAQINLGYATVTAPISGRIGRAQVTEGALVGQGEATLLATVQQIDPVYVNFTQSTTDVLRLRRAFETGRFRRTGGFDGGVVKIVLEDGSLYANTGKLLFTDLTVDPTSGQVTLRAEVPNPSGILLPGMYVRVRIEQAETPTGILLPQQSVQRGASGDTVTVVTTDGKTVVKPVKVGSGQGGNWVILEGLTPGEMVMVDGFQKLRGNAPVRPVPAQAAPAASGASGAASGPATPGITPADPKPPTTGAASAVR